MHILKTLALAVPITLSAAFATSGQDHSAKIEEVLGKIPRDNPRSDAGKEAFYRLSPGDGIQMEVLEDPSLSRPLTIGPDGRITVPFSGTFRVSDLTLEEAAKRISDMMSKNFALAPNVTVTLSSINPLSAERFQRDLSIFVIGEANQVGQVRIEKDSTLLQVFSEIGGFSPFAATKRIQLRRVQENGKEVIFVINYDAIVKGNSSTGLSSLQDGDVILVPERGLFEL